MREIKEIALGRPRSEEGFVVGEKWFLEPKKMMSNASNGGGYINGQLRRFFQVVVKRAGRISSVNLLLTPVTLQR
jgi:hypothetical protein